MVEMTMESIMDRLTTEFDYPEQGSELVAQKILEMQPSLRSEFDQWWNTGIVPTLEIEGYSVAMLMSEHNMNPIAAFLTMDWLLREPEKAITSLERGHDQIFKR